MRWARILVCTTLMMGAAGCAASRRGDGSPDGDGSPGGDDSTGPQPADSPATPSVGPASPGPAPIPPVTPPNVTPPPVAPPSEPLVHPVQEQPVPGAGTADEGFLFEEIVLDVGPVQHCRSDRWEAPDAPRRIYECSRRGRSGPFECSCDGELIEAQEQMLCIEALVEGCGVEADPANSDFSISQPQTHCESFASGQSTCWHNGGGEYLCRCQADEDVFVVAADSCEQAAFASCAADCESDLGACEIAPELGADQYRCQCRTYRGAVREVTAGGCGLAVDLSCNPGYACNGDYGYCDVAEDGSLVCYCDGGYMESFDAPGPGLEYDCQRVARNACLPYV